MVDLRTGEEAINRGLAKRLQQLADERERRERAALAADAEFTAEFLSAARAVFNMIDVDESGDLEKQEIVVAVKSNQVANAASYDRANFNLRGLRDLRNCCFRVFGVWWCGIIQRPLHASFPSQEVINFLINCGNKNLQYLLVPNRLQAALAAMDTDHDGHIDLCEWCVSESETLRCLRRGDGVLRRWRACGVEVRRGSPVDVPPRETCIEIALQNKLEQRAAAREAQAKAAQKEIAEFTGEFLSAARQCFQLIDKDCGGSLSKQEIVEAVRGPRSP